MIARFHFDDETLTRLLQGGPLGDQIQVAEHVEGCRECQARLETLAQDGLTWEEAGDLLRDRDFSINASEGSEWTLEDYAWSNVLQPTDHPKSLGRFARYEIMEILGRGGMGIVMRGFDPALNRHSAVKVLAPELASSAAARQRFSREAKSAAAVVHRHVVPIQTVDEHAGLPFLVMPVVEGRSLQQRVEVDGPLSVVESVRIAAQIAEGLAAAHTQGLVHRDIKPANILLENSVERVQITDFGLARAADDASMTRSGVIAGTPQYMSPEQAHGDEIDQRSDLFSLGSVLYFMLTGRSPFRAETTMGVLNRIANEEPRRLSASNPDVPEWLQSVVTRMLAKSPGNRFDSAESVARELNRRLQQLQDPACPDAESQSMSRRTIQPLVWTALASTVVAGLIYMAVVMLQTRYGTLRIEMNDQLGRPIRLAIRQGDEVVKRLTVDSGGAKMKIRAGTYSIELEGQDTSIELKGNQAVVRAGDVWTTRLEFRPPGDAGTRGDDSSSSDIGSRDPSVVRRQAIEDMKRGRYQESLENILWCWENGVISQPSWSAVRRSFLLATWLDLGENYPPALDKLESIRNALETRILSEDQVRVRSDDFADFAAINQTLRQNERTLAVFEKLDLRDRERVGFYLPKCPVFPANHARKTTNCRDCHRPARTFDTTASANPSSATDANGNDRQGR